VYSCPPGHAAELLGARGATQPPGHRNQGTPPHARSLSWPEPHGGTHGTRRRRRQERDARNEQMQINPPHAEDSVPFRSVSKQEYNQPE